MRERNSESNSALFEWGYGFCIFAGILFGIGLLGLNDASKNPEVGQGIDLIIKASLASAVIGVSLIGINKIRK